MTWVIHPTVTSRDPSPKGQASPRKHESTRKSDGIQAIRKTQHGFLDATRLESYTSIKRIIPRSFLTPRFHVEERVCQERFRRFPCAAVWGIPTINLSDRTYVHAAVSFGPAQSTGLGSELPVALCGSLGWC